jgi:DNA-binding CsgD family transcriptional regulator
MRKNKILILGECQYNFVGISALLRQNCGDDFDVFPDFAVHYPNAARLACHDISLVFFSKNVINMLGVIQNIVLAKCYSDKKINMLLVDPSEEAMQLLRIFGISIEGVSISGAIDGTIDEVIFKINKVLHSDSFGDIFISRGKRLTISEIDVFFDFLRGYSLSMMAKRRGTSIKTIYTQKNSAIKKLRVSGLSQFFLS